MRIRFRRRGLSGSMGILTRKLLRNIWQTKGQFLSLVAVVMVGISLYISMGTAYFSLNYSRDTFYTDNSFANYFFHVIRAPEQVTRRIAALPGITGVTGHIVADVPVVKEDGRRANAKVISYPVPLGRSVNRFQLQSGRMFEKYPASGVTEVLVDPAYAKANHLLKPGSRMTIVAEGREVDLSVVGTAVGPEFTYPIKDPADMMPNPEAYGIVMMPQNQAAQIFNLPGQINQITVTLAPGTDEDIIKEKVKLILEPYGNLASYPRKQQLSNAMLQGELDQLKSQSLVTPMIFLLIGAVIQFVMIGRMIKNQRTQIGIMKALGYNNLQIMMHYTSYSLAIALAGSTLGTMLGLYFASVFAMLYGQYFSLPQTLSSVSPATILKGTMLSLLVGLMAGLIASRRAIGINPAESMRSEAPISGRKFFLESWTWLWIRLSALWKMSLRTVGRNRTRFAITLFGVSFSVGMLVVSLFTGDALNFMLDQAFYKEQRYDMLVRFTHPVKQSELCNITRIAGIVRAEPIFELPVRLSHDGRTEDNVFEALSDDYSLRVIYDADQRQLLMGQEGVILNDRMARKLGLKIGDKVSVETMLGLGPAHKSSLTVVGINKQMLGGSSFVSLKTANRIQREEGLMSAVMMRIDPGRAQYIEDELEKMTGVASVLSRQKAMDNFNKNLGMMYASIGIMVSFALILGFAIVYNSSTINMSERLRELAMLRAIGMTVGEIKGILLNENLLQMVLALIIGLPLGRYMAEGIAKTVSTDIYSLTAVVYPQTYVYAGIAGGLFVILAHTWAVRGLDKIDIVELLKNRD
ncbi:MAG: ABC transporter permease [Candidatus Saccharibacteria bacterium]